MAASQWLSAEEAGRERLRDRVAPQAPEAPIAVYQNFEGGRRVVPGELAPGGGPGMPGRLPSIIPDPEAAAKFIQDPDFVPNDEPRRYAMDGATCGGVFYRLYDMVDDFVPQADGVCDHVNLGGIGTSTGCPILWFTSFQAQPGETEITSITLAWADAAANGNAASVGIYQDVSGGATPEESDPTGAVLLGQVAVVASNGGEEDVIVKYALDSSIFVTPNVTFYVAAVYVPQGADDRFPTGADAICGPGECPDDTGDGHFFPGRNWIGFAVSLEDPMADGEVCDNQDCTDCTSTIVGLIEDVGATPNTLSRNWVLGANTLPAVCGNAICETAELACDPENPGNVLCPADCTDPLPPTETSCTDNIDNDCDGDKDCDDSDCPLVLTEVGLCNDGLDNDCDAFDPNLGGGGTDCNDPDCREIDANCMFDCDGSAIAEGESACVDGQLSGDNFNGGCNAEPPVWDVTIAEDQLYCGETGNYFSTCADDDDCGAAETCDSGNCRAFCATNDDCTGFAGGGEGTCDATSVVCTSDADCGDGSAVGSCGGGGTCTACTGGQTPARDTDWWRINIPANEREITMCITAEFPAQFGFVDDNFGVCDAAAFDQAASAEPYVETCTTACLAGIGDRTAFVSVPFGWNASTTERYDCGVRYEFSITSTDCVPVASVCALEANGDLACQFPNQEFNGPDDGGTAASLRSDTNTFENGNTQRIADSFELIAGDEISEICWWGGYTNLAGVDTDCSAQPTDNFTVTYYANDNDQDTVPGTLIGGPFNVSATSVPTNLLLGFQPALTEYSYTATHPPVAVTAGDCFWVEIQNNTSATTCVWEWSTSGSNPYGDGPSGDGFSAFSQDGAPYANGFSVPFDLAWCLGPDPLLVSPSGCQITGGCCDQLSSDCVEDVARSDCFADDNRFSQDGCAALSPECGSDDCVADACFHCPLNGDPGSAKSTQADIGGGNGACEPDGACDGNDRFSALNCFSNSDTTNTMQFPCEDAPPAAVNTDAGGPAISCARDGVCDGNDAFHALACFSNADSTGAPPYPCPCTGPAPTAPGGDSIVTTDLKTGITLRAPRAVQAGSLVSVDVYLDDAIKALRGYQLHLGVSGTSADALELVDIAIAQRSDLAMGDVPVTWSAFNRDTAQMVVGMDAAQGVPTAAGAYLGTFTYRVPKDASGTLAVEALYNDSTFVPAERTFVFTSHGGLVDVTSVTPARITIVNDRQQRLGMR